MNSLASAMRSFLVTLIAAGLALLIGSLPVARMVDDLTGDLLKSHFSPTVPPRDDIAIVLITEEMLDAFPVRMPIDRDFLANLLRTIERHEPRAIGLDILLDKPSHPEADRNLLAAMDALSVPLVMVAVGPTSETGAFEAGMLGERRAASAFMLADSADGVIRSVETEIDSAPSFSAALARAAGAEPAGNRPGADRFALFRAESGELPFRTVPADRLDQIPVESDWLTGRIVVIGADLPFRDQHATSLRFSPGNATMPGVAVHAYKLAYLLDGAPRTRAPYVLLLLASLLFAGTGVLMAIGLRGFALSLAGLVVAGSALGLIVAGLYVTAEWYLPVTMPLLAVTMGIVGGALDRTQRLRAALAYVEARFGRYVDPQLDAAVARFELNATDGSREIEAAILFTDLAGFTAFVARHSADQVRDMLDAYLAAITEAASAHGAALDKIVGDGAHLLFIAQTDSKARKAAALDCALDVLARTEAVRTELAQRGLRAGRTRFGLSFGRVSLGSFGAGARADLTAHGTPVNLAARLVDLAGREGVRGAAMAAALPSGPDKDWRHAGPRQLKGIPDPVDVVLLD